MFVYSDITTDARVQRAAEALSAQYNLTLISTYTRKYYQSNQYKTLFVGGRYSSSILDVLSCVYQASKIIKDIRPDIVYCHDYYSSLLARLIISKKYCNSIIYDAHELFVPMDGYKLDLHQRIFYLFEKSIINKVDLLIGTNKERVDIMKRHYKLTKAPIIIRNISQLQIYENDITSNISRDLDEFFEQDGITLVYAGCVSKDRRIDTLLSSALKYSNKFKVLIVGDGNQLKELKEFSLNNKELLVAFTGSVPYSALGYVLSRCDIGYINYPTDIPNNIYCASNKIYEYTSVGLPILANNNPTVKAILEENRIGISTDDFDEGLLYVVANIDLLKQSCIAFSRNNSWENERHKLINAVNQISL